MEYIEEARQAIQRYEQRLQQTKQILLLYKEVLNNDSWYELQLKEEEISYTKSLKSAQESLTRIEQSRRKRLDEMTAEEKKKEYDKMCQEREATKMDYVLMYGFDAWEKR
jgi:hypothetical protein